MKALRIALLAIGLASLAAACGKDKKEDTTPENTGGDDMGGDAYGGMDGCTGHDDMGMDGCDGGE
jgi:hypothetical protein